MGAIMSRKNFRFISCFLLLFISFFTSRIIVAKEATESLQTLDSGIVANEAVNKSESLHSLIKELDCKINDLIDRCFGEEVFNKCEEEIEKCNEKIESLLKQKDCDPNEKYYEEGLNPLVPNRMTPLIKAAFCGYPLIVQALANDPRVNINEKDDNGKTALDYAQEKPKIFISKEIREKLSGNYHIFTVTTFVPYLSYKVNKKTPYERCVDILKEKAASENPISLRKRMKGTIHLYRAFNNEFFKFFLLGDDRFFDDDWKKNITLKESFLIYIQENTLNLFKIQGDLEWFKMFVCYKIACFLGTVED